MRNRTQKTFWSFLIIALAISYFCNGILLAFYADYSADYTEISTGSLDVGIENLKNDDGSSIWQQQDDSIDAGTLIDGGANTFSFDLINSGNSTINFTITIELAFEGEVREQGRLYLFWADEDEQKIESKDYSGALIGADSLDNKTISVQDGLREGLSETVASGALDSEDIQEFAFRLVFISNAQSDAELEMFQNNKIAINIVAWADLSGRTTGWAALKTQSFQTNAAVYGSFPVITELFGAKTFFKGQARDIDLAAYAIATDETEGDLTEQIVISSEPKFNSSKAGAYTVTYNVKNSLGRYAAALTIRIQIWEFVKIVGGNNHSLILTSHGQVYAFGRNVDGQLGNGTKSNSSTPILLEGLENIIDIAACNSSSFALDADGQLYSWGHNGYGHLGNGTTESSLVPTQVLVPQGVKFVRVFARFNTAGAVTAFGELYTWGYGRSGVCGTGESKDINQIPQKINVPDVVQADFGSNFGAAVTKDGKLYTWGSNIYGALGTNVAQDNSVYAPTIVPYFEQKPIVQVSTGYYHIVAITQDASLYAWGNGDDGRLGNGKTDQQKLPQLIALQDNASIAFTGYSNSAVILNNTATFVFGDNTLNKLGTEGADELDPALLQIENVSYISLMPDSTLIIVEGEMVYGVGSGVYGTLGTASNENADWFVPWAFIAPAPY